MSRYGGTTGGTFLSGAANMEAGDNEKGQLVAGYDGGEVQGRAWKLCALKGANNALGLCLRHFERP